MDHWLPFTTFLFNRDLNIWYLIKQTSIPRCRCPAPSTQILSEKWIKILNKNNNPNPTKTYFASRFPKKLGLFPILHFFLPELRVLIDRHLQCVPTSGSDDADVGFWEGSLNCTGEVYNDIVVLVVTKSPWQSWHGKFTLHWRAWNKGGVAVTVWQWDNDPVNLYTK